MRASPIVDQTTRQAHNITNHMVLTLVPLDAHIICGSDFVCLHYYYQTMRLLTDLKKPPKLKSVT
uniref:Uncharacterized protein n=1 Tax=Arion vulgaris TaxID=1028688 RepID=A0A0B7AV85_9EUPU